LTTCPCINCITLAVCKARVIDYTIVNKNPSRVDGLYDIYEDVLKPKCSLIIDWIDQPPSTVEIVQKRFNKIYNLFILNNPNIDWCVNNDISLKNTMIYVYGFNK